MQLTVLFYFSTRNQIKATVFINGRGGHVGFIFFGMSSYAVYQVTLDEKGATGGSP